MPTYDRYNDVETRFPKSEYEWYPVSNDTDVATIVTRKAYTIASGIVQHEVRWFGPSNGVLLVRSGKTNGASMSYETISEAQPSKKKIGCFTKLFVFAIIVGLIALALFILYGHN